ncbi:MAG: orotidine-5'-phosphate decarboxylase [Anaerolineae bacterium]|nr:orotidine-5'-phosphate decarboxylase [Anaerolineae bacterium]
MKSFCQFLTERCQQANSLLCVGLDPRTPTVDDARAECLRIIAATHPVTAAYKPNIAFFEAYGPAGMTMLKEVIAHIPACIPVILDAKRGDIPDTSPAYAKAVFEELGAHAVTASPYIGSDGLQAFFDRPERGVFVLCKTSNKGGDEFQKLQVLDHGQGLMVNGATRNLYEVVAQRAQAWNTLDNVCLVVGTTDPSAMGKVRAVAPDLWFLAPGVGAQGGDLQAAIAAGLRPDGLGLLFNVSRSVARAADPGAEALRVRDEINEARGRWQGAGGKNQALSTRHSAFSTQKLAQDLLTSGCVKFGSFTMKSGIKSPIYLDLRRLVTHPQIMWRAAQAYAAIMQSLSFDRIAGLPYAALPIATAVSLVMDRPLIYPRREAKEYGTKAVIEGDFVAGETAIVVDDLITTGGSKFEAIDKLAAAGLTVRDIVVLIDRSFDGGKVLADAGYRLHSVVNIHQLLPEWERSGAITSAQADEVRAFLAMR